MSLLITVYAFIDHRIYNFLISLNAFVVGFIVFCAFVIMLWGFGKNSYKNLKVSQHELTKAKNLARQQYSSKGYVDGNLTKHIQKLKKELSDAQRKYRKDLKES
jgi:predicted PurR-regulated permease PerM